MSGGCKLQWFNMLGPSPWLRSEQWRERVSHMPQAVLEIKLGTRFLSFTSVRGSGMEDCPPLVGQELSIDAGRMMIQSTVLVWALQDTLSGLDGIIGI
jgi:hypothetical protein